MAHRMGASLKESVEESIENDYGCLHLINCRMTEVEELHSRRKFVRTVRSWVSSYCVRLSAVGLSTWSALD